MKAQTGSRGITELFNFGATLEVGGQCHAPTALPLGKRPGTHCAVDRVDPRAGLDGCGKSLLHRQSIPEPSSPLGVTIPTELSQPTWRVLAVRHISMIVAFFRNLSTHTFKICTNHEITIVLWYISTILLRFWPYISFTIRGPLEY